MSFALSLGSFSALLAIHSAPLHAAQAPQKTLYEQLCAVNAEWRHQQASGDLLAPAAFDDERALLRAHIARVIERLAAVDTSGYPAELKAARALNLQRLRDYLQHEDCPRNYASGPRLPVMVDADGRHCPVAALLRDAGEEDFIQRVAHRANNVFVRDIDEPRFLDWAARSGLSLDEIAWIQPAYSSETSWHLAAVGPRGAPPERSEIRKLALVPGSFDTGTLMPDEEQLADILRENDLTQAQWQQRAADAGFKDISDTAAPLRFHGTLYAAGAVEVDDETIIGGRIYLVQRWDDDHWTIIGKFDVPIRTLSAYRQRLYVGGGKHPFLPTGPGLERALISSYDGEQWHRLHTKLDGEVRALKSVRGHLVAAVVAYIGPG